MDLLSEDALADTVDHCITSFATSMIANAKLKTFYIVWKLKVNRPIRLTHVVPNSNPLGIKRFVSGISISFKCECNIIMQIQYTENLNPGRFELGSTSS